MHPYVAITLTLLWYIAYPFWKLFQWIYYLLKPLRYLIYILSVPFIHIVHFLGKALCWPVMFLAKLEDLYIYLSCALLIGAVTGLCMYNVYLILLRMLDLTPNLSINHSSSPFSPLTTPSTKLQGRSVAEYRADRRRRKERQDTSIS